MIPERYPAPAAEAIFSDEAKIKRWARWTGKFLNARLAKDLDLSVHDLGVLQDEYHVTALPSVQRLRDREQETGHDVVAFLALLTEQMSPALKRHIHYGLTSSDLVENAHHDALRLHAEAMVGKIEELLDQTGRWADQSMNRAGRTHGQIAAPTSWNWQMRVHRESLLAIRQELINFASTRIMKSPGPTGVSPFWNGIQVGGHTCVPSTQIIPRHHQVAWAALYLRLAGILENLALQVRLGSRTEVDEIREGRPRVGSSAMPHKHNPIDSEKVCGLARVARGHFMALAEGMAAWEERDLTNSSVERIAVPGLAATVEHMTRTMIDVMMNLLIHTNMLDHAKDSRTASNIFQTLAQSHFDLGPVEAGELVRKHVQLGQGDIYVDGSQIVDNYDVWDWQVEAWTKASIELWESVTE